MSGCLPITIVGGGLAGLTLGIALRQRNVAVSIGEAGSYPRHRVCGEFICGGGLRVLEELGLRQKLLAAGGIQARTAAFHSRNHSYPVKRLPEPALCLSRFTMDELLANEFRRLGGRLNEHQRLNPEAPLAGTVRATGRRPCGSGSPVKWVGLKAHARNVRPNADLEMHFLPNGYVGVCRLRGDTVNVCGLFAVRGASTRLGDLWQRFLRGPEGSVLDEHLSTAEFIPDSFCAVSGLDLSPDAAARSRECRVGDALSMIPPVTGNGMSMAFESASLAVEPLVSYSRGERPWDEVQTEVARECDRHFRSRLRWAAASQRLLMQRGARELLLPLSDRCEWVWKAFFDRTR